MQNKLYKKELLKSADRFAQSIAGILFTVISLVLLLTKIAFIFQPFYQDKGSWLIHFIGALLLIYLSCWCFRYTYRGFKGYSLVKIEEKNDETPLLDYVEKKLIAIGENFKETIASNKEITELIYR